MGSAVSNGTTSVGTRVHEAGMNLATWTWAGWVKRTGAGESDYRYLNKAVGTAVGAPNITGQGAGSGAQTRIRGRALTGTSSFDIAITNDGPVPLDTWVCVFVVFNQGGAGQAMRIYKYDGVDSVDEQTYASFSSSGAAPGFNTADLTFFNTTDGSQCYAGKAAHWVWTPDVWDNATMLAFAQGTIPDGLTDHYWPLQSDGSDAGEVGGFTMTLSNVTFDGADSPPVDYSGGGADLEETETDSVEATDALSTSLEAVRVFTDPVSVEDLLTTLLHAHRAQIDQVGVTDSVDVPVQVISRSMTDLVPIGDTVQAHLGHHREIFDEVSIADTATGLNNVSVELVDAVSMVDDNDGQSVGFGVTLDDQLTVSDETVIEQSGHLVATITDSVQVSDVVTRSVVIHQVVTDPVGMTDTVEDGAAAHVTVTLTDSIAVADSQSVHVFVGVTDAVAVADEASIQIVINLVDGTAVDDSLDWNGDRTINLADSVDVEDSRQVIFVPAEGPEPGLFTARVLSSRWTAQIVHSPWTARINL